MFGFKIFAVAALASVVVAYDTPQDIACVAPVTVTVTETVCGTSGVPVNTPPVAPTYEPSPPAPPAISVESTATAPLSGPPAEPTIIVPPAPPAESDIPTAPPADSGVPVAQPSSMAPPSDVAPSSGVKPTTALVPEMTTAPSSTAAVTRPPTSTSAPETVSTAGAILPTPYLGLGSLIAAGAVFNAAMAVIA